MNVIRNFRSRDLSTATATLKIFEDPEHGLHTVTRSLPAGMDIGPDVWRFEDRSDALEQFGVVIKSITGRGFIELGEPRPVLTACVDCGENAPESGLTCDECREDSQGD